MVVFSELLLELIRNNEVFNHKLDISGTCFGDGGARRLADALEINTSLQHLNISSNNIGNEGARYLADALKTNTSLQNLDISSNNIGNEGAQHLADALKFNTSLQHLDITNIDIGDNGALHLADTLRTNPSLQHLEIRSNKIGEEGTRCLADALRINTSLQHLNISWNKIGDEGARHLADALKINTSLQHLNISFNKIGDGGARYLMDALRINPSLQQLNISQINKIGEKILQSIEIHSRRNSFLLKTRQNDPSLQILDFASKYIGDIGTKPLAYALKTNTFLQSLNISRDNIGDEGVQCLADALKFVTSLQKLIISSNNITSLPESFGLLHNLKYLDISDNKLQSLPFTFATLIEQLDQFWFFGNPLSKIPEAYRQSKELLIHYLRESSNSNMRRIKIMLVGEAAAGKTTFLKRLQGQIGSFWGKITNQDTKRVPTDGIDIVEWEAESGSMSFVVMDFAGQELYHVTHEFFLSALNTIFVTFFDLADEWKRWGKPSSSKPHEGSESTLERLAFWWNSIQSRAPGAHMCIVGSKIDRVPEKDRGEILRWCSDRLSQQFEELQMCYGVSSSLQMFNPTSDGLCFWPISSINNEGVGQFLEILKEQAKQHVTSQSVPDRVVLLHRHLCAIRSKIDLPLVSITQILHDHAKHIYRPDEFDQLEAALDLLCEWGTVVRFKDDCEGDLSQWIILDPQWLAEMFRSLIVSEKFKKSKSTKSDLPQDHVDADTLRNRAKKLKMTDETLEYVVKLFKTLQVAVEDPDIDLSNSRSQTADNIPSRLLIPGLLDDTCGNAIEQHEELGNFSCMERRYGMEFVPHGMIARLISETVSSLDTVLGDRKSAPRSVKVWRNGIVIRVEMPHGFEMSALVELMPLQQTHSENSTSMATTGSNGNQPFTAGLIPSTRRCIRLSVRADSRMQMGYSDDARKNDQERCRRMMRWLHQTLTDLISESYPGLKKTPNNNNESGGSIVPIIIHCPFCTTRQKSMEIGTFDYETCRSFFSNPFSGPSRPKFECRICKQQQIPLVLKKRDLIPEFRKLMQSSNSEQSKARIEIDSQITSILTSDIENESKRVFRELWSKIKPSSQDNNWNLINLVVPEIERNDFDSSMQSFARGGSGGVFDARLHGNQAALKIVEFNQNPNDMNSVHRIQRELFIMSIVSKLDHPNLLPMLGWKVRKRQSKCYILMPKASSNLKQFIVRPNMMDNLAKIDLMIQIAEGLKQLHRLEIAHRDLKPENILVFDGPDSTSPSPSSSPKTTGVLLKIADFGLSRTVISEEDHTSNLGSAQWAAPERLKWGAGRVRADLVADVQSDIFSLGFIFRFMWSRRSPEAPSHPDVPLKLEALFPVEDEYPQELRDLLCRCLSFDMASRPTAKQMCIELKSMRQTLQIA